MSHRSPRQYFVPREKAQFDSLVTLTLVCRCMLALHQSEMSQAWGAKGCEGSVAVRSEVVLCDVTAF